MLVPMMVLLSAGIGPAGIRVPVDPAASSVSVQLCATAASVTRCDTGSSPLSGFLEIALAPMAVPSSISLQHFDIQGTQAMNFTLDYGWLVGRLDATVTDFAAYHAAPGMGRPFVPILADTFTFTDVPYLQRGIVQYQSTNLVCAALQASGWLCTDTIDLSQQPVAMMTSVSGSIQITGGVVYLSGTMHFSQPLDPTNPALGTISGTATLSGSAPLPAPGDFDADGDVDLTDSLTFQACASGPMVPYAMGCEVADLEWDGDVDQSDFGIFQRCMSGENTPADPNRAE